MNFKESLVYNNKFIFEKNKKLDIKMSENTEIENLNNINNLLKIDNKCYLLDFIIQKYNIKNLTYDIFIEKLEEIFGNFILCISKDEDEEFILINKNIINNDIVNSENIYNLDKFTTTIYKKYPFKKISSFYTPYLLNNNAIINIKNLEDESFKNIYFKNCIEGVDIILFYDKKWKITTEKSLYGTNSIYRNKKINDLFNEIIKDRNIDLDIFCKNKIYYLTLVHHKNNGLISYNHYGSGYKELHLNFTLLNDEEKNIQLINLNPINEFNNNNNLKFINKANIDNVKILIDNLNNISYENMVNKKITTEGYNLYHLDQNRLINYKLQTHIYQQIYNSKPKYDNINVGYLELYQENKLKEYLPYYTNYYSEIIHRISMSIRTISKELLDIYHYLKKHKKTELYNNITDNYKKVLYKIHGIYIDSRKNDFNKEINNDKNNDKNNDENNIEDRHDIKSITVHDIYHYIKSLTTNNLKQLYIDRDIMLKEKKIDINIYNLFVKDCVYTMTQTKLMLFA